jgi:hypothetical protein
MLKRHLLSLLGALLFILWAGQPGLSPSAAETPQKKRACGDLWPVKQDNKWGYIDRTGKLVIPFKFDYGGDFSEGLAAVMMGEKTGYIDETGKFVIPPQSYGGHPFSEGLAIVVLGPFEDKGGALLYKYGYIDRTGKMVIKPSEGKNIKWMSYYYQALAFSEGLAGVEQKNKWGYIDKSGRQVIPPRYSDILPFSEGLAAVVLKEQFGYINRSGRLVIRPQFSQAGAFSEGLAPVCLGAGGDKWGYIDTSGKLVIPGKYAWARGFSEGLAAVMGKDKKFGFIDKSGRFVIPPQYYHVGDFSEGLAAVVLSQEDAPGNLAYINPRGQVVIKSMSTIFNIIDREGTLSYYRFCGGLARLGLGKQAGSDAEGYINREGKIVWPQATPAK